MVMKIGKKGLELIKHFEGFKPGAYLCPAKVWTIGYGTTKGVKKGQVCTEAQAIGFLNSDLAQFEKTINESVKVPLTQDQFDALVAFVYNIGSGAFKKSTLLKVLNGGHYDQVDNQMLRWNKGDGKVLPGLTRRRTSEGVLFSTGKLNF